MSITEKLVHLRYTNLVNTDEIGLFWEGKNFRLIFQDPSFECGKAYLIKGLEDISIPVNLLLWLSVYIGEDAVDPNRNKDTRFNHTRGSFTINPSDLTNFLSAAKRMESRKWPKWRLELSTNALIYYSVAVRAGIDMMPLSMGFFGLSLECIGNVRYGKRDKHYTLGEKIFKQYLTVRLAKAKRDPTKKDSIKKFEKSIHSDIELINQLRNAFYGHSLLHIEKDRKTLVKSLQDWSIRNGHSEQFAKISFISSRLRDQVGINSHSLYKVGLRVNRIFLFLYLGIYSKVPIATHDFSSVGNMSAPFVGEFDGMRFEFRKSDSP
jgi:hypothetical protein